MADYIIDCKQKRLGRVASQAAHILQGKKNVAYNPRLEGNDRVLIKNIDDLSIGGDKENQKVYYFHTGQLGHLKERKFKDVAAKLGKTHILRHAVLHMLPKNRLQARRIKRLIFEE